MRIYNWGKIFLLISGLIFIVNLSKDVFHLWRAGDRLEQNQQKLDNLANENLKLKKEVEFLKSDFFVEQQVRDKLNMAKPGEAVVILPKMFGNEENELVQNDEEPKSDPVWRQWLNLFW